ncbi:hypothetical protein TNCV_4838061 [Trichonephila clavipes]|uniref:Uncharacterized protein n=1 Tax=Trichonephila clavipes TaxID=2585209 RepID=A0A8X6R992_TRICX|nr:hypothetical protein TNCV_4838061 [Trichonephila clavipes]
MACQVTADLSPIEHVERAGKATAAVRDTGELTAQMQRDYGRIFHKGVISDLSESMPRRISACIAARGGFTTY